MKVLQSSRGFRIALMVVAALLIAEGVVLFLSYQKLQKEERRLKNMRRDLVNMRQVSPSPTETNAMKIEEALATYAENNRWEYLIRGGQFAERFAAENIPRERTDAYFDLVGFVERLRSLAGRQGVEIEPEEYFGFSDYSKEGPEPPLMGKIFRQRHILEEVLRRLLLSNPARLISVERSGGADKAEWREQSRLSLAVENLVETDFVRIQFTGETASLRSWLNRLAEHDGHPIDLPISVRSVEVQPMRTNERRPNTRVSGNSLVLTNELPKVTPLVERRLSEFTVVLEMLEIVDPNQEDDQ